MKKLTLKNTLIDQYSENFFIGNCIYIDGLMVFTGNETPKEIDVNEAFEFVESDEGDIEKEIKSLPQGKSLEKTKVVTFSGINKNKFKPCNTSTDKQ